MTTKECGAFIAELRKEHNLTQKQLAGILNVSDKAVSRWETGKGYPDVNSLVALSEYFNISINELLAGKKFMDDDTVKIADENIITLFKYSEKNKKKRLIPTILFGILLFIILFPSIFTLIKELFILTSTVATTENIEGFIVIITLAVLLLASGIAIYKGGITLLHSYHYRNVTDRNGYCKSIGKTISLMSIPMFVNAVMILFSHIRIIEVLSGIFLIIGMSIGIIFIFKIQIKYNGGLF